MSLYQLEREGDVEQLLGVLRTSDNPEIRARAASILGELDEKAVEDHDIVAPLVSVATGAEDGAVAAAAIDALDRRGQAAIEEFIVETAGIDLGDDRRADWAKAEAFASALEAGVPELRMAAANALGRLEQPDALQALLGTLEDPDPRVRARVARALGLIGDARATDALEGRLADPSGEVRREAAEALGNIGNRQAFSALLELFDDERPAVRRIVVGAMGRFGDARPVEGLVDALGDEDASVRRRAVYSLIELLSNVPTEQSHEIRETVVDELRATDDRSVLVPLVEILEESRGNRQRRNTAWLLGRVTDADSEGKRRVIGALVDAMAGDDRMTARFAATSLAELGGREVETALLELVDDPELDEDVRAQAVFTLGKVGGDRARNRLDTLIDRTESEAVRKRAFSAISKLGGRR